MIMQIFEKLHAFLWQSMSANNCNTYFIEGPPRILIDPGHLQYFEHVQEGLNDLGYGLADIDLVICTHAHPDHIEAVQLFNDAPSLFTLHEAEWQFIKAMEKEINAMMGIRLDKFQPDFFLVEGELSLKKLQLEIVHTPGHSPGGISIRWPEKKALFTGDLVFNAGLGRTDLPGGDGNLLKQSIQRLKPLDVDYILPGHGDWVEGAEQVQHNYDQLEQVYFAYI